jgi:ribosomal protein L37AE/L43A/transposase-like protein
MQKGVSVPKEMSIIEFFEKFGSNEQCRKDLWIKRLEIGFECPKCNGRIGYKIESKYLWQCKNCGHQVSLIAGTAFDNTKIGLQKWYLAAFFILSSKSGISAKELQHQIRVTYKTAWYVNRRLRDAMQLANGKYKLDGIVTMDEAYFSGRQVTEEIGKKRGRGTNKSKVIVAVSLTENGKPKYARMQVVDNFKARTIEKFAESYIEKGSTIVTDGFQSYKSQNIKKDYFVDYDMASADSEDSKLKWLHTVVSNAKSFILGTFHGLKANDLQVYLDEFCYRFNRRHMPHLIFDKLINSAIITPPMGYYRSDVS